MACKRTAVNSNQSEAVAELLVKSENVTHGSDSPGQGKNIGDIALSSDAVVLPRLSPDMTQEATDEAIEQVYEVMSLMRADGIVFERHSFARRDTERRNLSLSEIPERALHCTKPNISKERERNVD